MFELLLILAIVTIIANAIITVLGHAGRFDYGSRLDTRMIVIDCILFFLWPALLIASIFVR